MLDTSEVPSTFSLIDWHVNEIRDSLWYLQIEKFRKHIIYSRKISAKCLALLFCPSLFGLGERLCNLDLTVVVSPWPSITQVEYKQICIQQKREVNT